jgi:2-methylcitrate dehydratase
VLIASAVVASKLMGLSVEMATEAVNIAVNAHISMLQVRSGEISLWKAGSSGEAAKSAVFSAMLAAEGMTGPSPIFEGEYGYFKQVMGVDSVKVSDFGLGGKYSISDTRIKRYPSNGSTQTGICAAINARKSIENIVDIEKVEILTNARTYKGSGKGAEKWAPKTRETADHSLPYTVATALIDGTVSPSSYEPEKLQSQQVATLMNKITVQEDAALTSMFPAKSATTLKIQLKSGKVVVETVEYPKGHPQHPVSDEEIEIKFRNLVGGYLKKSQIQSIIDFIWMLEKQSGLGQLFESCVTEKLPLR